MANAALDQALENIYTSVNGNNEDIDLHIASLKKALGDEKAVTFDTAKMLHKNRQSRKMMQSYFKKRGLTVNFTGA